MGNSPPKKDPLPKSSNANDIPTTTNDSGSEELEPDERSSWLPSNYNKSSAIKIEPKSNNLSINTNQTNHFKKSKRRNDGSSPGSDLDLEIGYHMANLLHSSPVASSSSPLNKEYGSSVESDMSPVFTSLEYKDSDLLLSVGSVSSSPKVNQRLHGLDYEEGIFGSLDPISESLENSPAPEKPKNNVIDKIDTKVEDVTRKFSKSSLHSPIGSSPPSAFRSRSTSSVSSHLSPPVDIDSMIERLLKSGSKASNKKSRKTKDKLPVNSDEIKYVLNKSRSIFLDQPTLLRLAPPVKVVGDLHGQFLDLIRIFNNSGYPPYKNYLFLGDYVDRGHKSLETFLLLVCYKVKYPENFFMLRGNHESANITKIYGFYDECKRRLPSLTGNHKMWKLFVDVFNSLPIAATINDKIFCIHGGLSPELEDLSQIENIKRPTDVPDKGLLADLLWSDPDASVKTFSLKNWPKNDRGVSYCFGKKHVDYFCSKFGFELIVRGHMVVEDGYEFFDRRKLVTVFSAPNYCGEFKNFGAVMDVNKSLCCSFDLLKPT